MCNQLVVIITYPDVVNSTELAQKLDDIMSLSWENRDIFADQEDMTADMTTLTYFTCMVKIVALKFYTPPQLKKSSVRCCLY